jgi:RHS repeat-associated protein
MKKPANQFTEKQQNTEAGSASATFITIKSIATCLLLFLIHEAYCQSPSLTYTGYSGPKIYTLGTAITTLTPANSGGTVIATGNTSTLAGTVVSGSIDGTGTGALFNQPLGAAVDASGNIYVADAGNHVIRKITPAGVVNTFAGTSGVHGFTNGTGIAAKFYNPSGIAIDASGNLYVADEYNNAIRKITTAGVVTTLAGNTTAGATNGTGIGATFHAPCGLVADASGNLYVADYLNNLIRKIVISTGVVTTFAGSGSVGSTNGTSTAASFNQPYDVTVDASGNLYVADRANNMIRKITSSAVVSTLAGSPTAGSSDGTGVLAGFNGPTSVKVYGSGNIFVADQGNNYIRMITPSGVVTRYSGSNTSVGTDGLITMAKFSSPYGIAINASGYLYVSDYGNNEIRKIVPVYYSISPGLPVGLSINAATGAISGTPTVASYPTNYTVTAYSNSGSGSIVLNIAIGLLTVEDQGNLGFVQQENIRVSGITQDSMVYALNNIQKQTTRVYLDGQGRTVQTIGVQANPLQNDLIQPVAYDNLGRQTTSYLPYAGQGTDIIGSYRKNALSTDQRAFYNNTSQYLVATDTGAYTKQVLESSPLQRLLQAGTVGGGFQPISGQHYKSASYRYNSSTTDGNILVWNPDGSFTTSNYYGNSTLHVTDDLDEDNTENLSFTDLEGHMVLKRQKLGSSNLDTYYIYNTAGMISYVIPPKAFALMVANGNYSLTQVGVNNLVFHFVYDTLSRLVEKTVPAKGVMYIVYDPLNRPVLAQDSNMRFNHNWNYVKYDVKGRVVSQGIYTDASRTTRTAMQNYVSGLSYTVWYESRSSTSSTTGYYTNNSFPTAGISALAYNYYDDYDLKQNGTPYVYALQGLAGETGATTASIKGMPTMVWKTTVGSGLSNTWLLKVFFYDKRGNPIQIQSNNHVYYVSSTTLTDTTTMVPNFAGVPLINKIKKQSSSATTIKVQTNITYDQMYRVMAVDQYYNGSSTVTHIASYSYNEMGQLIQKKFNPTTPTTFLQAVDMRYNIRGQLLSINNSKLKSDTGKTNNDTNDLFGMQMLYDKTDANLGNTPYFNGKLSAVKWMSSNGTGGTSYERAFKYYYDAMNRDTAAIYAERAATSTGSFSTTHGWDEDRIAYDENGNIKTLYRNSATQSVGNHATIDNLTYTYASSNPNQLSSVSDASGSSQGFIGGSGTYTYDGNGNLTNEPYKGISSIGYNVLNRTDKISFTASANRYLDYTYDTEGNILRKRQYDNVGGVLTLKNTTDYVDGFVYTTVTSTQTLSYFSMPEGRVMYSSGTLTQEYTINDQQGNARFSFDNGGAGGALRVRQENSYYAFGLVMPGSTISTPTVPNLKLYNGGSEWQNDYQNLPDYYETLNRNYDAALGRWVGVDPVAESAESMTSYQYAGNNPIMFNDPLGDLLFPPGSHGDKQIEYWAPMYTEGGGIPSDMQSMSDWENQMVSPEYNAYRDALVGDSGPTAQAAALEARDLTGQQSTGRTDLSNINKTTQSIFDAYIRGGTVTSDNRGIYVEYYANTTTGASSGTDLAQTNIILISKLLFKLTNWANQGGQQSQQTNGDNGNFWTHLIGPGLIGLGQPITALKPIGMLGSKPGSSIASYTLRKVVPGTLKGTFGEEVGGTIAEVASTNGLGAALGRFVPVAGWIWTYTDVTWTYFNWTLDSAPNPQARQELLNEYNSLP